MRTSDSGTPREPWVAGLNLGGKTVEESRSGSVSFAPTSAMESPKSTPDVDSPGLAVDTPDTNLKVGVAYLLFLL
jgi:hypothetical protein